MCDGVPFKILKICALVTVSMLMGCATRPLNADKVTIVQGANAFTSNCKMLGTVTSVVNPWTFGTAEEAMQQALWNMQAQAYDLYRADTLSIQRSGTSLTEVGGQGVALKCYN